MGHRDQDFASDKEGSRPLIAEITLSDSNLVLVPTLREADGVVLKFEAESCTTRAARQIFFTAENADTVTFHDALVGDDTIREPERLTDFDGRTTYWAGVAPGATALTAKATELGVMALKGVGRRRGWTLRFMLADRESLRQLRQHYKSRGTEFRVQELYRGNATETRQRSLSKDSEEMLLSAYNQGYYDVPRQINQDVLAEQLGISRSAVSKRLRRATAELVESTLFPE